ncbi:MAG TPA: PilZ domain-containing protein [Myxococcales bacterium]|nr:PilZ domain-containing protein [Myxococcales bacterium]
MAVIRWAPISPGLDESWPVRYRFGSLPDLQRHLRLGHGFFLPDHALPGGAGSRAIVEIGLPDSNDRPLLHGRVRARGHGGVWLDLPMARPAARWAPAPGAPRRRARRVACDLFVEIHPRGGEPWLCRGLDVSETGMRVGSALETGVRGDELDAVVLPGDGHMPSAEVVGRIVWAGQRETGIEIVQGSAAFARMLATAVGRWDLVREVEHDGGCPCAQGEATGQRQP